MPLDKNTNTSTEAYATQPEESVSKNDIPVKSPTGFGLIYNISVFVLVLGLNCLVWGSVICAGVTINDMVPDERFRNSIGIGLIGFGIIFVFQIFFYGAVLFCPTLTLNYKNHQYLYMGCIFPLSYFIPAQLMFSYIFSDILASYGSAVLAVLLPASFLVGHIYFMLSSTDSSTFSFLKPYVYGNLEDAKAPQNQFSYYSIKYYQY